MSETASHAQCLSLSHENQNFNQGIAVLEPCPKNGWEKGHEKDGLTSSVMHSCKQMTTQLTNLTPHEVKLL